MHVALVSDTFARTTRFGLSRYSHEIHDGLKGAGVGVTPVSSVTDFKDAEPAWLNATGFRRIPLSRKILATAWSTLPEPRVEHWLPPVDLVHSLDLDYPVATKKPWVVTLHDLGVLTHPQYFGAARPWLLRRHLDAAVRRADAIICVSGFTADEFNQLTGGRARDRVIVIEEGVGEEFFEPSAQAELDALPANVRQTPFFLFTGSLSPRKNLARVVEAFTKVADSLPHSLVLTGAAGWDTSDDLAALAESTARDRIIDLGYVSDTALRALYGTAAGFLYPSLYEGFGLPILEAMAAGCPVITSNMAPMTEVAGKASLLVDPASVDEIAEAMLTLGQQDAERANCVKAGVERARTFSWSTCAARTRDVYDRVLGASSNVG